MHKRKILLAAITVIVAVAVWRGSHPRGNAKADCDSSHACSNLSGGETSPWDQTRAIDRDSVLQRARHENAQVPLWRVFPVEGGIDVVVDATVRDGCKRLYTEPKVRGRSITLRTYPVDVPEIECAWQLNKDRWQELHLKLPTGLHQINWTHGNRTLMNGPLSVPN